MAASNPIKVMIVDDSVLVRKYVTQIMSELDNIEVVATAPNGKIALQKIFLFKPDMLILDVEMPEMTGLELLKYMKENIAQENRPNVLMFSSLMNEGSSATFEALANGAADFIKKPEGQLSDNLESVKKEFDFKIKELYQSRHNTGSNLNLDEALSHLEECAPVVHSDCLSGIDKLDMILSKKKVRPEILAIGSSTGGPVSIRKIMDTLGPLPIPVVIAQHMPAGFTSEFAKNLAHIYKREVVEAEDGQVLKNGTIYISPGGFHIRILKTGRNLVIKTDPNNYEGFFFKPSVDIFFKSVREVFGGNAMAIVLSGMGKDGSIESVFLRQAGALTIAQDKDSSVVWGMPGNSVKNGGIDLIVDIKDIGNAVNRVISSL